MALNPVDLSSLERWSGLVLGLSGAGKTTLISTIPEGQRVLVLSSENGLLAIRDMLLQRKGEVKAVTIDSFADFKESVTLLGKKKVEEKYDWVVYDSLTEIGAQCLTYMNKEHGTTTWKRYEALGEETIKLLKIIRDMKAYNTLLTCLVKSEEETTGEKTLVPQYPGNMVKDVIRSLFDEVLYIMPDKNMHDGRRVVITDCIEGYPAKDRSGKLDYPEVPDLGIINDKILGRYNPEAQEETA
jgi:hypothetical protein